MEKPKPTQNHEQERPKTLEDYAVKTFPADLDVTIRPLTVIRSGQDGGGIRHDGGWTPGDMLCLCDTDPEEGISAPELFLRVHKPVKVNDGEYVVAEKIIALSRLQGRKENDGFTESYIQELYGKSTEEMLKEGTEAAEQIWRQKHPVGSEIESLAPEVGSDLGAETSLGAETPSNSLVEDTSDHERSLADKKVISAMGGLAAKATGIKKPIDTNKVKTNEPAKKPVEADKASTDLVDLPVAKSVEIPVVEKSMETNEANTDILPEDFKAAIDSFKQLAEDNNNQFFAKVQYITGELDRFRGLIKYNPTAAMNDPAISEMITSESGRIRDLEASRAESVDKFKNDINNLLEGLKSKIENEDEKRGHLVELTKHVDQMGVNNTVLGEVTNGLLGKLIRIRSYIAESQNSRWGIDHYKSSITQVIDGVINDLSIASKRRRDIVGDVEGIKREGYYQKR